ncbi:MAG: arsenite efflux transporter metallochaperone ArsD [Methyloligellaceae bacterium]
MPKIRVYDPAMCCSTGVCGPDADDAPAQFAAALDKASKSGVAVDRFGLTSQPEEYVKNADVKDLLESDGVDCLPLVFIDNDLITKGGYPTRAELLGKLGIEADVTSEEPVSACCAPAEASS